MRKCLGLVGKYMKCVSCLFFAFWMVATATFSTRVFVTAALVSLAVTGWLYWYERYGRELIQCHPVGYISSAIDLVDRLARDLLVRN